MCKTFPDLLSLDYTAGVIDGLKWCLNCGMVADANEIAVQIRKLQILQDDCLCQMEEDFMSYNNTYEIIKEQILETFPGATNIENVGVYKDKAVVQFVPFEGSSPYTATLFNDAERIVISIVT